MDKRIWLVSIAGGLLTSLSWWDKASALIILCSLIPFIYIYQYTINEKEQIHNSVFTRVLPGFIILNILTISWLRNASIAGAFYAVIVNSFLMSFVFWLSSIIYKKSNKVLGYVSLVTFWLSFEHLASNINILTPWLNLGNTLGNEIYYIQWYDITGVSGGSLWIWLSNLILFFIIFRKTKSIRTRLNHLLLIILIIICPAVFSLIRYIRYESAANSTEVLIVQTNINPYTEKFNNIPFETQLRNIIAIADKECNDSTDWIIFPETTVDDPFYEQNVLKNKYYLMIDSLLNNHRNVSLITGITTKNSFLGISGNIPEAAINIEGSNVYYEIYNSAMLVNPDSSVSFYHKSKLVPGIEKKINALPSVISEKIIPDLGGTMTGYGSQTERTVFQHHTKKSRLAPAVCYESVFGEFISGFINEGANMIVIITNDGWWDNTAGYKQHLMFARIRAIENRRSVARAANTGISCLIDERGSFIKKTEWWTEDVLSGSLSLNNEITFYTSNGDIISRYSMIFSIFLIIIAFVAAPIRKLRYPEKYSE